MAPPAPDPSTKTMIANQTGDPNATGPARAESFRRPLEFMLADHHRQRLICDGLQDLADALQVSLVTAQATSLRRFLTEDFPNHILDEEQDLFPMLLRRCRPEDEIDKILAQLSREHELDKDIVEFIVSDLERLAGGFSLANPTRFFNNIRAFVETQRRHLDWENRAVLPLARKRLSPGDLEKMSRNMAARRGLSDPGR